MGVEPISTDRQSVMLAVTPTNRLFFKRGIEGQARTDNLKIPDHEFYQLKYFYILISKRLEKGAFVASHKGCLFSSFLQCFTWY